LAELNVTVNSREALSYYCNWKVQEKSLEFFSYQLQGTPENCSSASEKAQTYSRGHSGGDIPTYRWGSSNVEVPDIN